MSNGAVWIGLDSLELAEVRRRIADGRMPNLAALQAGGRLQPLQPDVPGFVESVWRSFINGRPVGEHGWYFNKVWRPELGRVEAASAEFLRLDPFWDELGRAGVRMALLDVPFVPDPGERFDGIFLGGWQTYHTAARRSRPAALLAELEARFGRPWLSFEPYGPQTVARLLRLHREALTAIQQIASIAEWLLRREPLDLSLIVIGAAHRAGHYLWDLSQVDARRLAPDERRTLAGAMDDIYAACDMAVGRIAAAARPGARLGVFALKGMGPNPGWVDVMPAIVGRLHGARPASLPGLRHNVQGWLRSQGAQRVTRLLPAALHTRLARVLWRRAHDWSSTRFFAPPTEVVGLVRLNVAGRDRCGIVAPDGPAGMLVDELVERLAGLTALGTDRPIVAAVRKVDALVPPDAPYRHVLPDILVEWHEHPIHATTGVRIPGAGELRWRPGRRVNSGRSGNHRVQGWVLGAPELERPGTQALPTILDLVQVIRHRIGDAAAAALPAARRVVPGAEVCASLATLLLAA